MPDDIHPGLHHHVAQPGQGIARSQTSGIVPFRQVGQILRIDHRFRILETAWPRIKSPDAVVVYHSAQ